MVPNGWVEGRVSDLLNGLESGVSVNGEDRDLTANEKAVLKVSAVSYGYFDPLAAKAIEGDELSRAKTNPKQGQIIISRSNTEELVGASAFIERDYSNLFLPDKLWQTIPKKNANMKWLSYILASAHVRYTLSNLATGTSGSMKNITKGELLGLKILIPTPTEQKKIAKILSTWDQTIGTTERLLANSQQQKKALMQQLLTGKKRLLDKNGVRFSGEWKITTLSQMGKVVSGGTPDTNTKEYWDGDIHWLTPTDVTALKSRFVRATTRTISEAGVQNSSATILPAGSLMVCTRATIGALSISSGPICTNQGFKNIIPTKAFDVNFIYYLLAYNSKALFRKASGSTFLELSKKDFEKMAFPCPFLEEQQRIAAVLSTADEEIAALQQKLDALKQEKKALMQQLLTGKRRVKLTEQNTKAATYGN